MGENLGRLQRKKTKKKKTGAASSAGAPAAVKTNGPVSAATAPVKVAKKQKTAAPRKTPAVIKSTPVKPKENILSRSVQFLREVKMELKKVTWPSRKQTVGSTIVVLVLVMIISFFLGAVDIGLSSLVKVVLQ